MIKNNFRKATQYSLLCLIKSMVLLGVYSLLCMRIKSMVLFGVSDIIDVTNDPCSEWRRRRVFMNGFYTIFYVECVVVVVHKYGLSPFSNQYISTLHIHLQGPV